MLTQRPMELYYTTQEVCMLWRVSRAWVWRKLKSGELDAVNLGGPLAPDWRFPVSGLNAFLARQRLTSAQPVAARTMGELRRKLLSVPA